MDLLPPTLLKQIGGRAGRHGKQWEFGEVTCLRACDLDYVRHVRAAPAGTQVLRGVELEDLSLQDWPEVDDIAPVIAAPE